jgi:hypothetical protein
MKYYKPDLHLISAANAVAQCILGTGAALDGTCLEGPVVKTGPCQDGSVATGNCHSGTCALNCVSVGSFEGGTGCCDGTGVV